MKTSIFENTELIWGKDKTNWRTTKSTELYYQGLWTENEYGQDYDYECFKGPRQGGQTYLGTEINAEKKADGNINMKIQKRSP
jgi:hypothetical protein